MASIAACEACAEACRTRLDIELPLDQALRVYSAEQLVDFTLGRIALESCIDVCTAAARALRNPRPATPGICDWCAQVCADTARQPTPAPGHEPLAAACVQCERQCRLATDALLSR